MRIVCNDLSTHIVQKWEKKREKELSFEKGDIIRVIDDALDEMAQGLSADQPFTWFFGELRGNVGLFPTAQFLYKPSGKPVLDDENMHTFRNVVVLDATPLYIRYSAGRGSGKGEDADGGLAADVAEFLKPTLVEVHRPFTGASGLSTKPHTAAPNTARAQSSNTALLDDLDLRGGGGRGGGGGGGGGAAQGNGDDKDSKTGQLGSALRMMDSREFVAMLTDLQIACPSGHIPR